MTRFQVQGLSDSQASQSARQFGVNALPPPDIESFWDKLRENFNDPLIHILCGALVMTTVLAVLGYASIMEGVGIAVAVFLATFVATFSEHRNESSFQALQAVASQITCNVFRGGSLRRVAIDDIVVGDCVLLQAGSAVPADGRLVKGAVSVSAKSLTGETEEKQKRAIPVQGDADAEASMLLNSHAASGDPLALGDDTRCFRGSMVVSGEAVLLVERVGVATHYGRIASDLATDDGRRAPLQVKLGHLADIISSLGIRGAVLISVSFMFKQIVMDNGWSLTGALVYLSQWQLALYDLVTSVILAVIVIVVAVPEGLPMMIAIVLSLNMRKLLANQVLVRRLIGIETAGSMDLLFADKTGTLTLGTFVPRSVVTGDRTTFNACAELPPSLRRLFAFCVRESTSAVVNVASAGRDPEVTIAGGNATDEGLLRFLDNDSIRNREQLSSLELTDEILFSSVHKFSASQLLVDDATWRVLFATFESLEHQDTHTVTVIKGAPELMLGQCVEYVDGSGHPRPMTHSDTVHLENTISEMALTGTRFIAICVCSRDVGAFGYAEVAAGGHGDDGRGVAREDAVRISMDESDPEQEPPQQVRQVPYGLTLVGLVGLADQVRPESSSAVRVARSAGIQVVMVTGDRLETAQGVAASVGLLEDVWHSQEDGGGMSVLTSETLRKMTDRQVIDVLPHLRVVARALPSDKSRLVQLAQSSRVGGRVVGMTGDGVNDTAALKKADVSFAMGSGSEIAKEASDIVILDDNFGSILNATLYGRTIFKSIRKFIVFQSTVNVASTLIVFMGPFLGFDFPLTLIQLLWVNLVMDTLAALAFGGEPALPRYMEEQPVPRQEPIVSREMLQSFLVNGPAIAAYSILFLIWDVIQDMFNRGSIPKGATSSTADAAATARVQTEQEIAEKGGYVFLTAFFSFFILLSTFNGFGVRTHRINILDNLSGNPGFVGVIIFIVVVQIGFTEFGGETMRVVPLTTHEWLHLFAMTAGVIIPWDMARKWLCATFWPSPANQNVVLRPI